ncbi:MAG: TRAFAC clade GTPase domain-containing protein [Pirellulales bacterium]
MSRFNSIYFNFALLALILSTGCSRATQRDNADTEVTIDDPVIISSGLLKNELLFNANKSVLIAHANTAFKSDFGPLKKLQDLTEADKASAVLILKDELELRTRPIETEYKDLESFIDNECIPAWKKVLDQRLNVALQRDDAEREERRSKQSAFALGSEHRWFWLFSLLGICSLFLLFGIQRRHEIRTYLNGGQSHNLLLGRILIGCGAGVATLTLLLFIFSDGLLVTIFELSKPETAQSRVNKQTQDEQNKAEIISTQLSNQQKDLENLKTNLLSEMETLLPKQMAAEFFDQWWTLWETTAKLTGLQNVETACQQRFDKIVAEIENDQTAMVKANEDAKHWLSKANQLCGFIGLAALSLNCFGLIAFALSVRRTTDKRYRTCPLCLEENSLEADGNDQAHCTAVLSESPFEQCDFKFPSMFRPIPKLCFPTLGVPSAGKTHWLSMVYRQLNNGVFKEDIEFAKIRSDGSAYFDRLIDDILNAKVGPEATQTSSLPSPLVFNFIDNDKLGRSNILVNCFDYSGEVLSNMTLEDHQRKRAFDADGYFYFLDPTKPSDEQTAPLSDFRQDVRSVKNLKAGQKLRCPVALCVPKIDLLPSEPFARGSNVIDNFYDELGDIGWGMDYGSIDRRSDLMQRLRNDIWPNWEIERQINDLFGGRFMFFPFTPVGLNEPGETDLSMRTISPVGIVQPLIWLLHMNGYPVLSR